MRKLPVFDVLGQAFSSPIRYWWPLLPVYLGASVVWLLMSPLLFGAVVSGAPTASMIAFFAIVFVLLSGVIVLTHRMAADAPDKWALGMPVVRYIITTLLLILLLGVIAGILFVLVGLFTGGLTATPGTSVGIGGAFGIVLAVLVGIFVYGLGARLFLALPAAALGRKKAIRTAWLMSEGNTLRLLGAWVLYMILVLAVSFGLLFVVGATGFAGGVNPMGGPAATSFTPVGILVTLVNVVVNYYLFIFGAAFLTYSYLELLPNAESGATAADTPAAAPAPAAPEAPSQAPPAP
ncbi:hypothetical protein [Pyruvatibacter mobilis]|uniref:hypothetical protein n=1 Tax=Pyruvatibacter mobilis TaxID=1712261 RepID=UPI003BABE1D6